MILGIRRQKLQYRPLVIFLMFQIACVVILLPLNVFYGPFKNVRLSVIEQSYKSNYYEKFVRLFISDDKLEVLAKEVALYDNQTSEINEKSHKVSSLANQINSAVASKKVDNTQSSISDSELKKLKGLVINKKNGSLIYQIIVSIEQQKVYVYDIRSNKLLKEIICSTGKTGDETPKGSYKVADRGEYFFSDKYQDGAYYWTSFFGNYLFHSVPFDVNRNIEKEEAEKLGQPASHGCVRMTIDNAKWIYDNIPTGTEVIVE